MIFIPNAGDCFLIGQMAPKILDIIDRASSGEPYHHCGVAAPRDYAPLGGPLYAYDAWPKFSRRMPWEQYWNQLCTWADDWRYKFYRGWWTRPPMFMEVWRFSDIHEHLEAFTQAANNYTGIRYRMATEWVWGTKAINCSEEGARITTDTGLTVYPDDFTPGKKIDQTTPWEWRVALEKRGAKLAHVQKEFR